ncbi:ATP-grasp domain-containing protein [Pantoea agglomerans]|jgi:biotin carboxylase|uniref:ATP-grasp domain-containing protein n=1 Tax=Enterobacter agglomerans TaxID=549 RepID=UPI0032090FF3
MKPITRKTVGLVGCGSEKYRKYLLEQMCEYYDVWLFLVEDVSWQKEYISGESKLPQYSAESIQEAVEKLKPDVEICGLVCWDERYIIATADASESLGLRSAGKDGIRGCRDKSLSRNLLTAHGILQPANRLCYDTAEALEFAGSTGYPLVVKPRGMGGSIGVALVRTDEQLIERFNECFTVSQEGATDFQSCVLIEEFLTGSEISVDGYTCGGSYTPMYVARKRVGMHPHFEEIGHTVCSHDPLLKDYGLMQLLRDAHIAIGFQNGITHTEIKIAPHGYVIVEMNGRLGGDLIPYLASLAMDIKPGMIAAQIACGDDVSFERFSDKTAVIEFKYPVSDITVNSVHIPAECNDDPSVYCEVLVSQGDRLALPPTGYMSRAAYILKVGDCEEDIKYDVSNLINKIDIYSIGTDKSVA